jgi:hypothetical protein
MSNDYKLFYTEKRPESYASYNSTDAEKCPHYHELKRFIDAFRLKDKCCLEIGSGRGVFQDMVNDYYGIDMEETLRKYYHKPYSVDINLGGGGKDISI